MKNQAKTEARGQGGGGRPGDAGKTRERERKSSRATANRTQTPSQEKSNPPDQKKRKNGRNTKTLSQNARESTRVAAVITGKGKKPPGESLSGGYWCRTGCFYSLEIQGLTNGRNVARKTLKQKNGGRRQTRPTINLGTGVGQPGNREANHHLSKEGGGDGLPNLPETLESGGDPAGRKGNLGAFTAFWQIMWFPTTGGTGKIQKKKG